MLGSCLDGYKIGYYSSQDFFVACNCKYGADCYCLIFGKTLLFMYVFFPSHVRRI